MARYVSVRTVETLHVIASSASGYPDPESHVTENCWTTHPEKHSKIRKPDELDKELKSPQIMRTARSPRRWKTNALAALSLIDCETFGTRLTEAAVEQDSNTLHYRSAISKTKNYTDEEIGDCQTESAKSKHQQISGTTAKPKTVADIRNKGKMKLKTKMGKQNPGADGQTNDEGTEHKDEEVDHPTDLMLCMSEEEDRLRRGSINEAGLQMLSPGREKETKKIRRHPHLLHPLRKVPSQKSIVPTLQPGRYLPQVRSREDRLQQQSDCRCANPRTDKDAGEMLQEREGCRGNAPRTTRMQEKCPRRRTTRLPSAKHAPKEKQCVRNSIHEECEACTRRKTNAQAAQTLKNWPPRKPKQSNQPREMPWANCSRSKLMQRLNPMQSLHRKRGSQRLHARRALLFPQMYQGVCISLSLGCYCCCCCRFLFLGD